MQSTRSKLAALATGVLALSATGAHATTIVTDVLDDQLYQINITLSAASGPVTFSAKAKSGASAAAISTFTVSGATPASMTSALGWTNLGFTSLSAGTHTITVGSNSFSSLSYSLKTNLAAGAFTVSQVPEAESAALALAGLGVVGFVMSRRRAAA
ncbi:MAG: hypothetical protein RI907_4032 [Pseudomonadota bacterium]|jgi:hypothetical protein